MEIFIVSILCAALAGMVRMVYDRHADKKKAKEDVAVDLMDTGTDPVWDTSIKEVLLDDLTEQKINYIENPLPVPKRREHKEMDFALDLKGNDDFDLKDLGDRDFYDIE